MGVESADQIPNNLHRHLHTQCFLFRLFNITEEPPARGMRLDPQAFRVLSRAYGIYSCIEQTSSEKSQFPSGMGV